MIYLLIKKKHLILLKKIFVYYIFYTHTFKDFLNFITFITIL